MKTIRGIFYNLNESDYSFKYGELKFYFSSKFYCNKFKNSYIEYLKDETYKLQNKYKCVIHADEMVLINLYKQIEKRGFRVLYKNKEIKDNYYINILLEM